jgi:hypothetical protein
MMKQLQQLQELARKLVTRELRRAEWEEQQKAYLAQKVGASCGMGCCS